MAKLPADYRPAHEPYLIETKWQREKLEKEIIGAIEDGLPVRDAFQLAGVNLYTYYRWRKWYQEDIEAGFKGTELIQLMENVAKADKNLFRQLSKSMMKSAEEGNVRMQMYLADNRFGYANRRKNKLELGSSNKDDGKPVINIVNMTSVDEEEEEVIDVHGECRDDSDPAALDK